MERNVTINNSTKAIFYPTSQLLDRLFQLRTVVHAVTYRRKSPAQQQTMNATKMVLFSITSRGVVLVAVGVVNQLEYNRRLLLRHHQIHHQYKVLRKLSSVTAGRSQQLQLHTAQNQRSRRCAVLPTHSIRSRVLETLLSSTG
jgi:hypothetical protein